MRKSQEQDPGTPLPERGETACAPDARPPRARTTSRAESRTLCDRYAVMGGRWHFLLAAALALAGSERAAAQETVFISNINRPSAANFDTIRAVPFTTGADTCTLTSVDVKTGVNDSTVIPLVRIFQNGTNDRPGTQLATLTNPSSLTNNAANNFTAPANTSLSANTTY